jgi:hypothetical protein
VEAVDGSENRLYEHVTNLIKSDQGPCLSFSRVVAENVDIYHKRFRDRQDMVWSGNRTGVRVDRMIRIVNCSSDSNTRSQDCALLQNAGSITHP